MSRHWGRTELVKILGLLALSILLLTLPGWAGGYPLCPQDGREYFYATDADGNFVCIDKERVQWTWECKHRGEWGEVAALLERCLEYVKDGDALRSPYSQALMDSITLTNVKYDSDKSLAEDRIRAAEREVKRLKAEKDQIEKETKLRRDIEALLQKLRGMNP